MSRPAAPGLPAGAGPVELPDAEVVTTQAGEVSTRWVLRVTVLLLVALAILCAVGPHIPSGE